MHNINSLFFPVTYMLKLGFSQMKNFYTLLFIYCCYFVNALIAFRVVSMYLNLKISKSKKKKKILNSAKLVVIINFVQPFIDDDQADIK